MGHNRIGVIDFSQILVPIGEPNWASLSRKHYPQPDDLDGVVLADVLGTVVLSTFINSTGVQADPFAALYFEPTGSALDQVPGSRYDVPEILGELNGPSNEGRNPLLLPLILDRIETVYGQPGFASEFRSYFQGYLADVDPETAGAQQYANCANATIHTLEQAFWCGPAQTWPAAGHNQAYIEFWHHLDRALANEIAAVNVDQMGDMGPALVNDQVWTTLFELGNNPYNGISVRLTQNMLRVDPVITDQLGNPRATNGFGDIGAVEIAN
jgi:hypothetical protein